MKEEVGINAFNIGVMKNVSQCVQGKSSRPAWWAADNSVFVAGVNNTSVKQTGEFVTVKQERTKNLQEQTAKM